MHPGGWTSCTTSCSGVVATPRSAPAVQAMVVLEGVVLRVLALRGAELGDSGPTRPVFTPCTRRGAALGADASPHSTARSSSSAARAARARASERQGRRGLGRALTNATTKAASSASETSSSSEMSDSDVSPMYGRRIAATAGAASS